MVIEQNLSRYNLGEDKKISEVLDLVNLKDYLREECTVDEFPIDSNDLNVEGAGAYFIQCEEVENDESGEFYQIEYVKKDIYSAIYMHGARKDYELLKNIAKEQAERI